LSAWGSVLGHIYRYVTQQSVADWSKRLWYLLPAWLGAPAENVVFYVHISNRRAYRSVLDSSSNTGCEEARPPRKTTRPPKLTKPSIGKSPTKLLHIV
jgi:hypothetical protein